MRSHRPSRRRSTTRRVRTSHWTDVIPALVLVAVLLLPFVQVVSGSAYVDTIIALTIERQEEIEREKGPLVPDLPPPMYNPDRRSGPLPVDPDAHEVYLL